MLKETQQDNPQVCSLEISSRRTCFLENSILKAGTSLIIFVFLTDPTQQTGGGGMRSSRSPVLGSLPTALGPDCWSMAFDRTVGKPDPQLNLGSNWAGRSAKDPQGTTDPCF